ncbi:MAG: TetR/AcrR family transcriptional regulator, partial [Tomitella sp.]|nr:TetR/AcrR family transcriptional regulator [Tomitella sp.]
MTSDASPAPDAERAPSSAARSGRRPGSPDTRDAILRAARARFADVGFERASVRSIAKSAGVDSALVHHYFGTKKNLLAKAMAIPVDPETVLSQIR